METQSENQSPNRVGRTRRLMGWIQWEGALLKNHLIISIRNLRRQAVYSWINIGGLAVGMATCFVIFLFVRYELVHLWPVENVRFFQLKLVHSTD